MLIGLLASRALPVARSEATFQVRTGSLANALSDCFDIVHIWETVSPGPEWTTTIVGLTPR